MHYRQSPGNVLTEYGLLIGLVAVASVASLNLLGNSVSGVFGKVDNGLGNDYVSSILGGSNEAQVGNLTAGGASPKTPGTLPSLNLNANGDTTGTEGAYEFEVTKYGGTDTNATSANGSNKVLSVTHTLDISQDLYQASLGVDPESNPNYYNWLVGSSQMALYLASSETAYGKATGVIQGSGLDGISPKVTDVTTKQLVSLSESESLRNAHQYYVQLLGQRNVMQNGSMDKYVTPQQKAEGIAMVDKAMNTLWATYPELKEYTSGPNNTLLDANKLQADMGHMMNQIDGYDINKLRTGATTILSTGAANNNIDVKTSLQTGVTSLQKAESLPISSTD